VIVIVMEMLGHVHLLRRSRFSIPGAATISPSRPTAERPPCCNRDR